MYDTEHARLCPERETESYVDPEVTVPVRSEERNVFIFPQSFRLRRAYAKRRTPACILPTFLVLGLAMGQPLTVVSQQRGAKAAGPVQPAFVPIATGKQRICREKQIVEISQGSQKVTVDYFTEVVIATMNDGKIVPERLIGETVSLVRDTKQKEHWIILRGGASDGETMAMPENVFRIEKVLASTREKQVKMKVGQQDYSLQPGEVLFLLG